jgi:hypothetical protein
MGLGGLLGMVLAFTSIAHANDVLLRVTIPFSFVMENRTLPAGEYIVSKEASPTPIYYIRQLDGAESMFFTAAKLESRKAGDVGYSVVFDRIGDAHFLSTVWLGSPHNGLTLSKSKHERELLASGAASSRVEIAQTRR